MHFHVNILSQYSSFVWYAMHKLEYFGVSCLVIAETKGHLLSHVVSLLLIIFSTRRYHLEPINDKYQGICTVYASGQMCLLHAYENALLLGIRQCPPGLTFWKAVKIWLFLWNSIGWSWSWKKVLWVVSREFVLVPSFSVFIILLLLYDIVFILWLWAAQKSGFKIGGHTSILNK